jgi:hypothetical protein
MRRDREPHRKACVKELRAENAMHKYLILPTQVTEVMAHSKNYKHPPVGYTFLVV